MKVLISGSRNWQNKDIIKKIILKLKEKYGNDLAIVEGDANGTDKISGGICRELGLPLFICPANWTIHGKAAGTIRNLWMLSYFEPDLVIGFSENINESKGTKHCLDSAKNKCIKTLLVDNSGVPRVY